MTNGLCEFWRQYEQPGFHELDAEHIPGKKCVNWDLKLAKRKGSIPADLKTALHKNLIAHPFLGTVSPERALVFILFGNPGCEITDYDDELVDHVYARRCQQILRCELNEFLPLHDDARGTGAARYWRASFKSLAMELGPCNSKEAEQDTLEAGYAKIRRTISVLEACAYHSAGNPGTWVERLPSAGLIRRYVHDVLLPRAHRQEILLLVWRKAAFWRIESEGPSVLIRPSKQARGRYLYAAERSAIRKFIQSHCAG